MPRKLKRSFDSNAALPPGTPSGSLAGFGFSVETPDWTPSAIVPVAHPSNTSFPLSAGAVSAALLGIGVAPVAQTCFLSLDCSMSPARLAMQRGEIALHKLRVLHEIGTPEEIFADDCQRAAAVRLDVFRSGVSRCDYALLFPNAPRL